MLGSEASWSHPVNNTVKSTQSQWIRGKHANIYIYPPYTILQRAMAQKLVSKWLYLEKVAVNASI